MKSSNRKGFTLVELIVVIAIIAILAVTAFVVLTKWISKSRDSRRLSDVANIQKALETSVLVNTMYPMPDNGILVYASGTSNVIGYQGDFGDNVVKMTDSIKNTPKDPMDTISYVYYISADKEKYQLLYYLENTAFLQDGKTYAVDYTKRQYRVVGDKLGVLMDTNSMPVHKLGLTGVDLQNTATNYTQVFDNTNNFVGTGKTLLTLASIYNKDVAKYDPYLLLYLDMSTTALSGTNKFLKDFSPLSGNVSCIYYTAGQPDIALRNKCGSLDNYLSDNAVKFSSGNALLVPSNTLFDIPSTGGITACVWHKVTGLGDQDRSNLVWRNGSNKGFGLAINRRDGIYNNINADYGNNAHTYFGTTLTNKWVHTCAIRDSGNASIYVNGNLVTLNGGYNKYAITYTNPTTGMPVILGAGNRNPDAALLNGYLDEPHIYNRALTDREIYALYNIGRNN